MANTVIHLWTKNYTKSVIEFESNIETEIELETKTEGETKVKTKIDTKSYRKTGKLKPAIKSHNFILQMVSVEIELCLAWNMVSLSH